jgi:hypothetical protein
MPRNGHGNRAGGAASHASSEVTSIATSWDGKLGIVDFSNARVSFLSVSSITHALF